eukprot:scaffold49747_cov18-Prasinocladus_malaysianus.AAC.1
MDLTYLQTRKNPYVGLIHVSSSYDRIRTSVSFMYRHHCRCFSLEVIPKFAYAQGTFELAWSGWDMLKPHIKEPESMHAQWAERQI